MAVRKIAISVPEDVLDQVDAAAAERNESRSAFIARVCMLAARVRRDRDITRRINALFADPGIQREQRETARAFQQIGRSEGTEWDED